MMFVHILFHSLECVYIVAEVFFSGQAKYMGVFVESGLRDQAYS